MTKFLDKTFHVTMPTSNRYRDNWDAIFAKKTLTDREIFDKVKAHLLAQNEVSLHSDGAICAYRDPRGFKCAAGALIHDKFYTRDLERHVVGDRRVDEALIASGVDVADSRIKSLVRELQLVHDRWEPLRWPVELDKVERKFFGDSTSG